ncbi:MAG TPA: hypothetical protein VF272_01095 [Candidatus Saccharimonadia bacterium]
MKLLAIIAFCTAAAFMVFAIASTSSAIAASCPQAGCIADNPSELDVPNLTPTEVAEGIIRILSFIAGVASVAFLIIGGLRYSSSSGNSQRVESAKQTIIYAVIGLILSIFSVFIVGFVISRAT